MGVDIDSAAVAAARQRLVELAVAAGVCRVEASQIVERNIVVGDGFTAQLPRCDAVLTNPPFGNAIEVDTARSSQERAQHRAVVPEVAKGAYDRSFVFAARAIQRLKPGGRYGLILPRSALSVDGAKGLRRYMDTIGAPDTIVTPTSSRLFEGADVFVTAVVGGKGIQPDALAVSGSGAPARVVERTGDRASWAALVDPELPLLRAVLQTTVPLGTLDSYLRFRAGAATGAAYELAPLVEEGGPGPRLVTTGLIDRYTCLWGQRRCRYLKRDFRNPTWPEQSEGAVARAAAAQACPKILVAGLSKVLEAVADPDGTLAGVVSTWWATPENTAPESLFLAEALLNAPVLSLLYIVQNRGKELSGGSTTIGKRELSAVPVPADFPQLLRAQTSLPAGMDDPFTLDPEDRAHRARLAATAGWAVQRRGWAAPTRDRDLLASAAIARLYGLDRDVHRAVQTWFDARCAPSRR
jgi:hypothetical protein